MIRTVRIDPGLRVSAARAHRNALVTLPERFRIVDGAADILVGERWAVDAATIAVVPGAPQPGDLPGWIADSPVGHDRAALAFVAETSRQAAAGSLLAVSIRVQGADATIDELLATGLQLVDAILPGTSTAQRTSTVHGGMIAVGVDVGATRVALTGALVAAPTTVVSARAVGAGTLTELEVPEPSSARPSTFRVITSQRTETAPAVYSSSVRDLWLALTS